MSIYTETLTPRNNAGGETNVIDCWTRFRRFLILGTEGGTYYVKARDLTEQNFECIHECAKKDFDRAVKLVVEISQGGYAPKNTPAIVALAVLSVVDNAALKHLNAVCRTGTHLFEFVQIIQKMRGWGRELKRAVANWYNEKSYKDVAYQVTKYQQRGGMSHKKVMRLCHIPARDEIMAHIVKYVLAKDRWNRDCGKFESHSYNILNAFEQAKAATDINQILEIIRGGHIPWECVPTKWLNSPEVWKTLVANGIKQTALIRNLGRMTACGALNPFSETTSRVCEMLTNTDWLKAGRTHPYNVLLALRTYQQGYGFKGKLSWHPVQEVCEALEVAFQESFHYLEQTNKKVLVGLDVSGSMGFGFCDGPLDCREAGAALIKSLFAVSKQMQVCAFTSQFAPLNVTRNDSLNSIITATSNLSFGSTDCAVPILYAKDRGIDVDMFVIITDNEHWAGSKTPDQALREYRNQYNRDAKLVSIGMVATKYSIASGPGTLNVVGFDSTVPQILTEFMR